MSYTLNGQAVALTEEPHEKDGVVYVPLKEVVTALGGTVTWDNETKTAAATIGQWTATFQMAENTADVNGTAVTYSAPSYVDNGELYVPVDFFQQAYGYKLAGSGTDVSLSV
ncbi:hypothetical protein CCAX7_47860 [Capsulimonas corticalis]|uniref:Copper amine oxidase-like N-terminal domain-containing protein n=1 Tax=Capsulimonas corticalis TaxID=2219043 RepID=A0A402CQ88_9BACT|nr:copper amine oxidase N-terminal domain-containing protein [Capsulimonas corticalis]BDI32735.1 hypothetical protein CCAX7_47860 [Capsulimonas corticalis]